MILSAALETILGFSVALSYLLVVFIAVLNGITIVGDSASLTAGVVAAAPAGFRGTSLTILILLSDSVWPFSLQRRLILYSIFSAVIDWPGAWNFSAWLPAACWG